jgi:hypothetical protein
MGMRELGPGSMPEITEENLVESQPRVRAQLMLRYELMWSVIQARIEEDRDQVRPLDPRLLEIGKGILKEEAALYRLARPAPLAEEDPDLELTIVDRRELVAASLDELELKRQAQAAAREAREQAAKDADAAAAG